MCDCVFHDLVIKKHNCKICVLGKILFTCYTDLCKVTPKTDFPLPSPWTSGKSVKGVLCCLCLCTNTQQSSRTTDEHNTGSWVLLAWQGSFVLFGAQQTTPKLSAALNNPNHKGYKIRFPDFWLAQNWKVCGVPCIFDETEGSVTMGDLAWLCTKVGHENVEKWGETAATLESFLTSDLFSFMCCTH